MKRLVPALVLMSFLAACGGDNGDGGAGVVIPATDADRVARAGLPTLGDLPGDNWRVIATDQFGATDADFLEFIRGNPECTVIEGLATLETAFGGDEVEPAGRAQVQFEQVNTEFLFPTQVEVEIDVDESPAGSQTDFAIVKGLLESRETSDCLISALNSQFAETGPAGVRLEVTRGDGSASAPQNGARMAFDIGMTFAGLELEMAMQMYFWPYGNAMVQVLFLGAKDTLSGDLVGGVLEAVDNNLQSAARE